MLLHSDMLFKTISPLREGKNGRLKGSGKEGRIGGGRILRRKLTGLRGESLKTMRIKRGLVIGRKREAQDGTELSIGMKGSRTSMGVGLKVRGNETGKNHQARKGGVLPTWGGSIIFRETPPTP